MWQLDNENRAGSVKTLHEYQYDNIIVNQTKMKDRKINQGGPHNRPLRIFYRQFEIKMQITIRKQNEYWHDWKLFHVKNMSQHEANKTTA